MMPAAATRAAILAGLLVGAARLGALAQPAPAQTPLARADTTAAARGSGVARDSAQLNALTRQVASQLRCPVCQGLSLADSPSELALEMKDVVRDQLAAGRTPEEVKQYFVAKYGEWILLEPTRRGVNLLVYALPALAVVAGLGVIWVALRRWTSGAAPADDELPAAADALD
jgi:cytochrome c-type biogenesis protein CcmH